MDRPTAKRPASPRANRVCRRARGRQGQALRVAAEGAAILDCRSTRTAFDVCGRDEGRAPQGAEPRKMTKDVIESAARRLRFPVPVPRGCRDAGKRKREAACGFWARPHQKKAISGEPSVEHLTNQNAANFGAT